MLSQLDYLTIYCQSIRTTNSLESTLPRIRHRTDRTRGFVRVIRNVVHDVQCRLACLATMA